MSNEQRQKRGTAPPAKRPFDAAKSLEISIDPLPYAVVAFTGDGTIFRVNAAAVRMFEADSAEQILGRNIYRTGESTRSPEETAVATSNVQSGREVRLDKWSFETLKGNRRLLDITAMPLVSPQKVEYVIGIARDITEQDRAEREQALLAAIVQSSDDAILSISSLPPKFPVITWNKGAERLFGFTAEEAIGRSITELYVAPELRADAADLMKKDMTELSGHPELVRHLEVPVTRKDGTRVDVSITISGVYGSGGELLAISNIVRDITARKRAEREQALLAAIIGASDDVIVSTSLDNTILSWNPGAERVFEVTSEQALGHKMLEFVSQEEHERVRGLIAELSRSGKPVSFRLHSRKKDGTPFYSWVNLFPTCDENGKLVAVGAVGRDITDLVRLEREQAELATIVNASRDAIIGFSKDLKITSWNSGAEATYGFTPEEAIGHGFDLFVPPEELERALEADRRLFETGEPVSWEQRAKKKDGSWFVSQVNIFPIRDNAGKIIAGAGIGHDITRLKQIETELREAHEYTRGLIESSIDAMVMIDGEMRIMDGNQQLARMLELPKKALLGTLFENYFTDAAVARAAIKKTFTDGFVTNVDLVVRTASGKEVPVSFNASLFYKAGKVFGIFGVARDETEQRATERTLREEREYSRSLIQSSPDALLVADSSLTLTDVNERTLELTGYKREELSRSKMPSLFTDPVRAGEVMEQARDAGAVHDVELLLLTRSAREIPVSLNASSFRGKEDTGHKIVVAVRDISESKRAQAANSLLASIVGSSGDAIYSETPDMLLTSWNPAAEVLFGYSASEVIGRSAALLLPLNRRAEHTERIRRICQTRKAEHYEAICLRKDGSAFEVTVVESPMLDSAGYVVGVSVVMRDTSVSTSNKAAATEVPKLGAGGETVRRSFSTPLARKNA